MMVNQNLKTEIFELKRIEEALKECEATFSGFNRNCYMCNLHLSR